MALPDTGRVVHRDDVDSHDVEVGEIAATWTRLGEAAGVTAIAANRIELAPGRRSTPLHVHATEEEIFWVAAGSGLSLQGERAYEIGAGDTLVHRIHEAAHTLLAGPDGLDVIAFGESSAENITWLPHAKVMRVGPRWLPAEVEHPYRADMDAGPLAVPEPSPRVEEIVALADVPTRRFEGARTAATIRDLGRAAGSERTGLRHVTVDPGAEAAPPHCHSAEHELFVVLDGEGTCTIGDEEHPIRAGSVVGRPAGTGVAHCLRAGESGPMTVLAHGTREPSDMCFYPRSSKVSFRGLGVIARVERLSYWDGE